LSIDHRSSMINRKLFRGKRSCSVLIGLVFGCVDDHILVFIAGTFFLMVLMVSNHSGILSLATVMSWNDSLDISAVRKH